MARRARALRLDLADLALVGGEIYRDLVSARPRGEVSGGEGEIIVWAGVREPEGRPGEVEPLFALPFTGDR